jgi:cell division protein FtsA
MGNVAAAIEFGTSKVMCVIGRSKSMGRFEVIGSGSAVYEGIKGGRWVRPENVEDAVSKALYIAEKRVKKHLKEVYVSVPGTFCRVVCQEGYTAVGNGIVSKEDVDRFVEDADFSFDDTVYTLIFAAPVYFQFEDGTRYIDVIGSGASELRGKVSAILVKKQYIDDITGMLKNAGVKVKAFIPEILAESLFLIPPEERDASAVLLNIGFYDTNVTVVYGDSVVYNKTIHAGGMHITNDLSLVMNIDLDMSEQMKKQFSFGLENSGTKLYDYARPKGGRVEKFSHPLVSEIIEARVEHICQLVSAAFEQSPVSVARRTRIFLSGGGLAMMKGAKDILERLLKRQVRLTKVDAPQLSTPNCYSALALLDYVLEAEYMGEGNSEPVKKRPSEKMYG